MAKQLSLARPYARALFALAGEQQQLPSWQAILNRLAAVAEDATVRSLLLNPDVTVAQIAALFEELLPPELMQSEQQKTQTKHFILLLIQNQRLTALPAIAASFAALIAEQEQTVQVEVNSAFELADKQQQQLVASLQQRLGAKLEMTYQVDQQLIGGVVVRSGNWVMDGSIKGRLQRLHDQLVTQ